MLYYAVGDVHGCAVQLDQLLGRIETDAAERADGREWRIVMLGDYVDRGPDSAGVMARVMALDQAGHVVLPGNHEDLMFNALTAKGDALEAAAEQWWCNGGKETLQSYSARKLSRERAVRAFSDVPKSHRSFLKTILTKRAVYHRDDADGLFFVHAGVQPRRKLSKTRPEAFLWTRDKDFMAADGPRWREGLRVVHGHTAVRTPDKLHHRVGLDTGAVYGGALTCGVFDDGQLVHLMGVAGPA